MIFFSAVVPTPPRRAIGALILSGAAPMVVIWLSLRMAHLGHLMSPSMMLLMHGVPYVICAGMAYLASRVVHNLGTEVARATELGSYRLVERLGSGGMGEVWKATHQMLARPAAIKFIRPEAIAGVNAADASLTLRRFELEARSTAGLSSAHTVNLYDFGVTDDGDFYYVMELLDRLDCEELVRRFGGDFCAAVCLLRQVCQRRGGAAGRSIRNRGQYLYLSAVCARIS
jgi:serine/threonine-protein kinase